MSADNWTICPKCIKTHKDARDKAIASVRAQYGKLTSDEFIAKLRDAEAAKPTPTQETLREDYELGTSKEGVFMVSYSCGCSECGFTFKHRYEQDVPIT